MPYPERLISKLYMHTYFPTTRPTMCIYPFFVRTLYLTPVQGVPMLPLVLPPALQAMIPMQPANATPEQLRNHHTAAAAAAAAAASMMAPGYSHGMMMPPTIVPLVNVRSQRHGARMVRSSDIGHSAMWQLLRRGGFQVQRREVYTNLHKIESICF